MTLDIESVLAGHEGWDYGGPGVVECEGCGWKSERLGPEWNSRRGDRHRAHVAAVLREQIAAAQAEAAKAATTGALRYAAGLIFGLDEELAETLYRVADEAAVYDFAEDLPCCPICEEVICDDGCPFEPYRAAQLAPSRVPGEGS